MKKLILLTLFLLLFISNLFAADGNTYNFNWLDDDEVVYVLQNKEYPKHSRFGLDFYLYDNKSSNYQKTTAIGLSVAFNFNENFSVDFTHKNYANEKNTDLKNLLADDTKPLIRKVNTVDLLHFNWIPFYGKVNAFNNIYYFDWGVGVGIGKFATETNYKTFQYKNVPLTYESESLNGFNIKTYFKLYATNNYNFGFQYDLSGFNAIVNANGKEELIMYNDLSIFVGYLF